MKGEKKMHLSMFFFCEFANGQKIIDTNFHNVGMPWMVYVMVKMGQIKRNFETLLCV